MATVSIPYKVPASSWLWTKDRGNVTTSQSQSSFYPGDNVKTGSVVPGYIDRIRLGIDAGTFYTRKEFKIVPGYVDMGTSGFGGGNNYTSFRKEVMASYGLPSDFTFDKNKVVLDASYRLKRKLREHTGQSNQLINLVELRELPKTVKTLATSASKLVKVVLESNRRGSDLKAFASDQWLNFSFGILPTLNAADDLVSSINDYLSREDHSYKDYGIHLTDWSSSFRSVTSGSLLHNIGITGSFRHSLSAKITAGYRYNLSSANNYNLGKHLGFDISSVVPTAYELLPYSWLIDYFTTAGQFIEDQFSADFGTSRYICENVIYRIEGDVKFHPIKIANPSTLLFFNSRPTKFSYFYFTRTPLVNLPRAPLRLKTTDEIANHAVNKLLNLTAILGSRKS